MRMEFVSSVAAIAEGRLHIGERFFGDDVGV